MDDRVRVTIIDMGKFPPLIDFFLIKLKQQSMIKMKVLTIRNFIT